MPEIGPLTRHARLALACALILPLAATHLRAAERVTGPEPALAPTRDQPAAGSSVPSTVYRDADGKPYVLRGPNEKQYLADYNVTWIDENNVLTPPGVGHFN